MEKSRYWYQYKSDFRRKIKTNRLYPPKSVQPFYIKLAFSKVI